MTRIIYTVFVIVVIIAAVNSQNPFIRQFRKMFFDIAGRTVDDRQLYRMAVNGKKIQKRISGERDFPCDNPTSFRSKERPTSVHTLQPGDIDVIAAMGDSLTAASGAGALTLLQIISENRGVSWSIGGKSNWKEFLTLPNILKQFNPNLIGYSTNDGLSHFKASHFNVAELAAMSEDLIFMARELVKRIKNDPRVNLNKDWKLITIMMGANDFCFNICYYKDPFEAVERHRRELNLTLNYLMQNLPRTIVNLVPAPDVQILREYRGLPAECAVTHRVFCPCTSNARIHTHKIYNEVIQKWRQLEIEITRDPEYDREDFTIVSQPFTMKINTSDETGSTDISLLSPDCFHLSQKGHAMAANALWNNMMEPVGAKTPTWHKLFQKFLCPKQSSPYIYTNKNSFSTNLISD